MAKKLVTAAIVDFLAAHREQHPGQDLLDRYLAYGTALETQVNVAAGDGEPVAGKRATWTDGVQQWWNLRIPKKAWDKPEFKDYKLSWPLEKHAEGIGTTGWDWKNQCSRWLGFDFDALTTHAVGVGIDEEKLKEVRRAAEGRPYVEVRRSTGGKGIHLYVHLDAIPTANHTEHAALARCILGMMSSETGFDFASQIDCCGGVMWIWHRKMTLDNRGLELLKPAEQILTAELLPANWKDHIEVVTRRRHKVRLPGLGDEAQDPFDILAAARLNVPLDATHKAIIDELAGSGFSTVWVSDHHLVQTHTVALQRLMDESRDALALRGFFKTNSPGSDPATPNCFMFPLPDGAWKVYRFSPGISEAETWEQDGEGWTTCYFNHDPDLKMAARVMGGAELADNKGFQFEGAEPALKVAEALGEKIDLDGKFLERQTTVRTQKDGRLVMRIKREDSDAKPDSGWAEIRGGWWEKVFSIRTDATEDTQGAAEYDNDLRRLVTTTGDLAGWFIRSSKGPWTRCGLTECKNWLQQCGHPKTEAEMILGDCVGKPWELVSMPFQSEEPGGRRWNFNSPQFRHKPPQQLDEANVKHPHWDRILQHCFCDLTNALKDLEWAQKANIRTGAQYGLAWIACCLRDPFEPLPFLFLFGSQNCGKSILHEAISLLVTGGVVRADRALTNNNDFNGELANGVLAVIEEKTISQDPQAYNRIKDWVTSRDIWIRRMRTDAYKQPNSLHFIMCANEQGACPIFPGDTRITVVEVPDLIEDIPKSILTARLEEEAPHFMYTLMNMELPQVHGRLRLPVVDTHKKKRSEDLSRSALEIFLRDECHLAPGHKVLFTEFFERFHRWLDNDEKSRWSKIKVSRELPSDLPSGAGTDNKKFIGNISLEPVTVSKRAIPYICIDGRLRQEEP